MTSHSNDIPRDEIWNPSNEWEGDRKYNSESEVWDAARSYFNWCVEHEIRGKPRAFTKRGLCVYMSITNDTWSNYKAIYPTVTSMVDDIIFEQKFTHAAVDIFNANLISKDLGMMDRNVNINAPASSLNDDELNKEINSLMGLDGTPEQP